ncbi:MAG: sn-glycerol-3-phosphate ABC transporter permease UgpE [Alphaproteobacteria bacterium]|nr:sn-glycerol-3-phosphate ABC transporter permease UgpE [Alphaproteobacteria bacterium]
MVENRPWLTVLSHAVVLIGLVIIAFPVWMTFVASTHDQQTMLRSPIPLLPGPHMVDNYVQILTEGYGGRFGSSKHTLELGWGPAKISITMSTIAMTMINSMIMALGITIGKIAISIIAAFAIVYFRFPFRMWFFWAIFITLMLPVEVRIVPTYGVVASLGMLDSYSGLIIPLIASATATFLFRQFFMSVPDELTEAARVDGAGPMRFFWDILLPMSRTTIAALFVIQFIYGWNQYLWPLLITTKESFYTVVMAVSRQANVVDSVPSWNLLMTMAMLAMLPPVLVVVFMQRQFVRGLVETEK